MELDRFKDFDNETRSAVLNFEQKSHSGTGQYFDMDELETVIDFYLETNDLDAVLNALQYADRLFPQANEFKLRRAHMYTNQGNPGKALPLLKEILLTEPGNTDAQYAMGIAYGVLEQPRKAIQYYQLAAADGVELGLIYGNIGDEYYKMDNLDKAIVYYKKAIAQNPDEERSMFNLLCIYEDLNRDREAEAFFRRQTETNPYSFPAWLAYGRACVNLEQWQQAIDAYEYAVVIEKTNIQAYFMLANAYRQAGNLGKAVSVLHESLEYADDKSPVYYSMGMIYMECGNAASAIVYFRKTVQEDSYYGDAWQVLGQCYANENDIYTAIEMSERALSINPRSASYMLQLAWLNECAGDEEKADSLYQCAIHLDEVTDECWIRYADFLMRKQRYDDAIAVLDKGLIDSVSQVEFNMRLAVCYFKTGRRNFLFNTIRACTTDPSFVPQHLIYICPEMVNDHEVVSMIDSH